MDIGGIDIIITGEEKEFTLYPPRLEVQVKSTSTAVIDNEFVRYPLKLKNYNELRKSKTLVPEILIIILLPDNPSEWVNQSETELCLRRCGYWLSLLMTTGNAKQRKRYSLFTTPTTIYGQCNQKHYGYY